MFKKVLIANRGEIACRVIRSLKALGVKSIAVYSEADADAPHVADADEAYLLGPAPVADSYLNQERLLEILQESGAEAIHPGYGLLSENADFAEACESAGLVWMGPRPLQMRRFGLKHTAREIAEKAGVPLLTGTNLLEKPEDALSAAERITYPVMLKSTAGGGGIGMTVCHTAEELAETFEAVVRLSQTNFGQGGVFLEKYITRARHIEVQIFGDGEGNIITLGERDCSAQRRNQKVVEESPAPDFSPEERAALLESAKDLGSAIKYRSAGTVEYLYDADEKKFYFLEVNTRLQVEHPVTELCTGVDLVEWMIRLAAGETDFLHSPESSGHAIEVRLYAEDAFENFQPSSGLLTKVEFPSHDVRIDSWISSGTKVSSFYDPMLAKLIVHAETREAALEKLSNALNRSTVAGIETNLEYLRQIVSSDLFVRGKMTTRALGTFNYQPRSLSILTGGMQTTVQDYPGRLNYWSVGIPPSGPMDSLSFRQGNLILGNDPNAAGIEITQIGPTIRFNFSTQIAITGARFPVKLDGQPVSYGLTVDVPAGSVLDFGNVEGRGMRAYLAIAGGIDVPEYLGSRSTFTLGQFGGHGGRALQIGDVLHIHEPGAHTQSQDVSLPKIEKHWDIGVLYGPHGAPDFFTDEDIDVFFSTDYEVHYNSARTGVRLIGPKPQWARPDGGEAGLHPSNIHDNAYAIGAIDFTGDMPVILGPDGPSLGGFVCPAVIVEAELWKIGQLSPGDTVRFKSLSPAEARQTLIDQQTTLTGRAPEVELTQMGMVYSPHEGVTFRRAGDSYLLVEFGELVLDLELRFKVHVIYQWLLENQTDGVIDITPGIRSLQIHFDQTATSFEKLIDHILKAESDMTDVADTDIPARTVYLPLSWDDPSTQVAIEKYTKSVYPEAPWCPSNIEFIRRINGLDSIQDVHDIVFSADYLVMGLGDVYLGAPVATPLDPRHRLVTTKYNPARTWTPENAVGIGGAYMCVYGMEGPGGYQFVGRTVQMWNRYKSTADFHDGKPWLLRFFDHVKFYPVSSEELTQYRKDFLQGRFKLRIEDTTFNLKRYQEFLEKEKNSIAEFRAIQSRAFQDERQRWEKAGLNVTDIVEAEDTETSVLALEPGQTAIESPINGSIWKILVKEGQLVEEGLAVAILEAMKMEMNILAPKSGTVVKILAEEGQATKPGAQLIILE